MEREKKMEALMCNEDDVNFRISQKLYLGLGGIGNVVRLGGIGNVHRIHLAKYFKTSNEPKDACLYQDYVVIMQDEDGEDLQREVTVLFGEYDDLKRLERQSHRSSFIQVMTVFEDDTVNDGTIVLIEDVDSTLYEYFRKMSDCELFERSKKFCVVDFSESTNNIIRQLVGGVLYLQNENLCFGGMFTTDVYVKFRHKETMPELKFSKVGAIDKKSRCY